jgi:hypothetical protein
MTLPNAWAQDNIGDPLADIYLSSNILPQGETSLVKLEVKNGQTAKITWQGEEIALLPARESNIWQGFIAADLQEKPGHYKAYVNISPPDLEKELDIEVVEKDYGVRRLTLPKEMVDLDEETFKRVQKEYKVINGLWEMPMSQPLWSGFFIRPVDGEVVGPFGRRSVINDQPRSPHTGVDLRGAKGTPVKAANDGKVILISDHYFTGKAIYLDHGGGVISMYFHLNDILVKDGDEVKKGHVIGLVGSTGRSTGPHLHWGMRINNARVNPLSLVTLSGELEE